LRVELMARTVCFSSPLSGAAPFLRTYRLGWGLLCYVSNFPPSWGPNCLPSRAKWLPALRRYIAA